MPTIHYNILGLSNAASMITEALYKLHDEKFEATIIENVISENPLPFAIDGVAIKTINCKKWNANQASNFIMGVYRPSAKEKVFEFFQNQYGILEEQYAPLIYPNAEIAETAKLGAGIFINPNVVLAPYCKIGKCVSINRQVTVGHHTTVEDFCTINPGVNIAGSCHIGKKVNIGMGSNIIDGISIGKNSIIGAGALVTKDIPENVVAYGSPAKIVRKI